MSIHRKDDPWIDLKSDKLELTGPAGGRFKGEGGVGEAGAEPIELDAVEFCRTVGGRRAGAGLLATPVPF